MKLFKAIKNDFFEILPPMIFFFVAFVLILTTKRMILSEYQISWTGFGTVVVGAILAGKVVLMVDKLPFVDQFPDRPLVYNTLWKSLLYFLAALVVCYLDQLVHFLRMHEGLMEANRHLLAEVVWPHFWVLQMWLAVLFLIFCAMRELIRVIGRDKFIHLFFGARINKDEGGV
ncbi:MAG: hypothetical protein ACYC7J_08350 [Syntrophales bacterium]